MDATDCTPIDVLCIGHAAYDLSFFVDSFPVENNKYQTEAMLESCGGPAANAAYLLSKWNCRCAFAGLVGDDAYGREIEASLARVNTDVSLLELRTNHPTPVSLILVNQANGSRTIVNRSLPQATFRVDPDEWRKRHPKVLLFDGHALEASLAALDAYPDAISILDAGSQRKGTVELAGRVDFVVASERFATQVTELSRLDNLHRQRLCIGRLRERFPGPIAVTIGEHGYLLEDDDGFVHEPAFPVNAVDTTAAGDIFHGAFAFAMHADLSFRKSLRVASAAAALSVQTRGGRPSVPDLADVETLLQHHFS